jgi:argininosuccinate lyase
VGKLVRHCAAEGKTFQDLSAEEAAQIIPGWDSDLHDVATSMDRSVARRNVTGGTAPKQVARQIARAEQLVEELRNRLK